jgi:predicted transcriptional regulator
MMATISIRIPSELKKEMDEMEINWSGELRNYIKKEIRKIKREKAIKNWNEIRKRHGKTKIKMSEVVIKSRKEH